MVETTAAEGYCLETPSLDPVWIETSAAPICPPYPLDAPTCVIELESDGEITAYRMRRPKREGEGGIDEYLAYAQMLDCEGKAAADAWLWEQVVVQMQPPDAPDWRLLTPEMKQHVPDSHKRQVIYARYLCRATVLMEKSETTFAGGSWCAQLEIGTPGAPVGVLECIVDEWDNHVARVDYQQAGASLAARLPAAERVFNSIFQSCAGGTIEDLSFTVERRAEFLRWLESPFKLAVVEALAAVWDAPLAVSMRWE